MKEAIINRDVELLKALEETSARLEIIDLSQYGLEGVEVKVNGELTVKDNVALALLMSYCKENEIRLVESSN